MQFVGEFVLRFLEFLDRVAHSASELGEFLRAEEQKNNEKNKKQIAPRKQVRQAGEGAHGRGNIQTRWPNLQGISAPADPGSGHRERDSAQTTNKSG